MNILPSDAMRRVRITRQGKTVATSRNLRGVLDFARKHPVDVVTVAPYDATGHSKVTFYFWSGDKLEGHYEAETQWADISVLIDWLHGRRSWGIERLTFLSQELYDRYAKELRAGPGLSHTTVTWREPKQ